MKNGRFGHSHSFMIDLVKGSVTTLFFCLTVTSKLPIVDAIYRTYISFSRYWPHATRLTAFDKQYVWKLDL